MMDKKEDSLKSEQNYIKNGNHVVSEGYIDPRGIFQPEMKTHHNDTKVFINACWYSIHDLQRIIDKMDKRRDDKSKSRESTSET